MDRPTDRALVDLSQDLPRRLDRVTGGGGIVKTQYSWPRALQMCAYAAKNVSETCA